MEHSLGLTTYQGTKLTSTYSRIQKYISSIFSEHDGMKLEIDHTENEKREKEKKKKKNCMETKHHAIKKTIGQ